MRVLQICLRVPYPPNDGGTIAMYNMAKALLKAGIGVKILALNTRKHFTDLSTLPSEFISSFRPETVYLDATVKPLPALSGLFGSGSYNISRFDIPGMHSKIRTLLAENKYDVIQLESLFVAPYLDTIRKASGAKVIFRSHNVEYLIWERMAASAANPVRKWYLTHLAGRLKKYEEQTINKFDGVIALTREDEHLFRKIGCTKPILISPIGIDTGSYPTNENIGFRPYLFHLGSMDWMPNQEGINWFLEKVYPLLNAGPEGMKIFLAGKNMPDTMKKLTGDKLVIEGAIADAKGYMKDKPVMIVPLLSGGGMRVKIIEGMAMGKTIISTSVGAEGIRCTNGVDILIADTPDEFARAILTCISDPGYCRKLGEGAVRLAVKEYDNLVLGKKVRAFYDEINPGAQIMGGTPLIK